MPDSVDVRQVVVEAFHAMRQSVDDVVIDDDLNTRFISNCRLATPNTSSTDLNWMLFNLRKSGDLGPTGVRSTPLRHDDYLHAAEIAARVMEDRYGDNIDRVFCDPTKRKEFDEVAARIASSISTYRLRKAALRLRKGRRLRPELIKRIADWGKRVKTYSADQLRENPSLTPRLPGVYIFRDDTGYLYIGEAKNLRSRVTKHLDHSDRKALARYLWDNGVESLLVELHAFSQESDGAKTECRRAYESELIAKRNPRFNAKP